MLNHQFENSSSINATSYDDDEYVLSVTFNSGKTYRYVGVPREVYDTFVNASSPGRYFQTYIKPAFQTASE